MLNHLLLVFNAGGVQLDAQGPLAIAAASIFLALWFRAPKRMMIEDDLEPRLTRQTPQQVADALLDLIGAGRRRRAAIL